MPSTTLRDVADLAGVSIGTASAALNNRPTVSSDTRAKVVDAAISLGYPIKETSAFIQQGQLSVIGLLMKHDQGGEWTVNQFYSQIQMGITNACNASNISVMVSFVDVDSSDRPISWPVMLNDQRLDGLVMAGIFLDETVAKIQRASHFPIVLLDGYSNNRYVDSVIPDNVGGARQVMQHLFANGHQHIGLVGWNPDSPPSVQDRYLGYVSAMNGKGYPFHIEVSSLNRENGYKAALRLLENDAQVTAIFGCNDETAIGVIDAAQEKGLRVPQDLSVVGFDDIQLSHEIDPPLTTIHVHKSWMGTIGISTLIDRARNPKQPRITRVISTHLVNRKTVAACRDS